MLDCMVDLETTGVLPDRTAILQIAAVQFNLETGEVFHNFFNRCLMMPPHRFWQESTRGWWMQQKREVIERIMARAEEPRSVIQAFSDWCQPLGSLRLWAKPSHFEFPFISSYFHDAEMPNPFHYRHVNDMNSWIRARYFPGAPPEAEKLLPFDGDAHDALFDVLHQIKVLMWHYKNTSATSHGMGEALKQEFEQRMLAEQAASQAEAINVSAA